ncbi:MULTISPECIES: type II toxin-antitoxin system RelE/ParE family toxin [unclassified Candidatus Tisiphia]|jgi:plasmid stabilization system protein ParE|uniref:type II toxin-antitoxin system RelE/ParE family toxin n=1 Tax=unclassified Candidatus Tisiphia TaxID=2996318 RepID=UPI001E701C58|nr:MAG: type II toxin-antitoxin system RelE/ParE family toxin [Rickettsia endosymbiont of Cimex lectularius]
MSKNNFCLTVQAEQDIKDIWLYIAKNNPKAAEKIANLFEQAFFKLAANPDIGSKREDLTDKPVRFWLVYNYYIIYNPKTKPLQILRVISSYRDIKNNYL